MILVEVLLLSLVLATFGVEPEFFGLLSGISELIIGLLGFYAAGAIFLNNFFGRTVLPLGKPLGLIAR